MQFTVTYLLQSIELFSVHLIKLGVNVFISQSLLSIQYDCDGLTFDSILRSRYNYMLTKYKVSFRCDERRVLETRT